MSAASDPIVIAGAGVAGLAAAYRLQGHADVPFVLFERSPHVGGHSRTLRYGDFRLDLGGHRFYTKKAHVQELVEELVGEDLLEVDRLSRVLFNGRFFHYPLGLSNTLKALGIVGAGRAALDYGTMKLRNAFAGAEEEETFEQWALSRFGRYLYEAFFRVYTEKTWGVPCTELSADFAEQRIKGLSFREAVKDAILRRGEDDSLVRRFIYPRYGFGQIPDAMARAVAEPNRILTEHDVIEVEHGDGVITAVVTGRPEGGTMRQPCCEFINCIAVDELVRLLRPAAPPQVMEAAAGLRYRSVVVLFLVLNVERVSPDHWIYVPSPEIGFCRLHEPKNWSRHMSPPDKTSLVLEYFCQEGDSRWNQSGSALAEEAACELEEIGLLRPEEVMSFTVVRIRKAYPIYTLGYEKDLKKVRSHLAGFANLQNIGRSAGFCYTSSDNYVDMGFKAAENVMGAHHDLECIGREAEYAEELSGEAL